VQNLGLPLRFQLGDTALMIGMVMGNQDALQRQPFSLQTSAHGCSIARIDDEGTLARVSSQM
jgi:hypothetical protein